MLNPAGTALPATVWVVVVVHGLLLVATSVLYPVYRAPDEAAHVDMVLAVTQAAGYPEVGDRRLSPAVERSQVIAGAVPGTEPLDAAAAPSRHARPTFAALDGTPGGGAPQQMAAHPPLYYVTAAGALAAVTALVPAAYDWSFDQVVGFLRLWSAVLVLPLPVVAYRTLEQLRAGSNSALSAAIAVLAVPAFTHVGAAVTNDALLALLAGVLTLLAVTVAGGDLRLRTALAGGAVCGLALLTKGFALIGPVVLAAAYLLAAARRGRRAAGPALAALAVAGVTGGWWWLRNLAVHGTVQPAGLPSPLPPPGFAPDAVSWLGLFVERMNRSFWLGEVLGQRVADGVVLGAAVLLVVLVVAALVPRPARATWPDRLLLAVPVVTLAGIVAFGAWRVYARSGQPLAIHGRYLYAALPALVALAALGASALLRGRTRWLPAATLATAGLAQAGTVALALTVHWAPPRLQALLTWAPWGPWLVTTAAIGGVLALTWLGVAVLATARAQGGHRPVR